MTPAEAKQVIEVLARGIDPETGEVLPQSSPINSPHVIRALFLAAQALEAPAGKRVRAESAGAASKAAQAGKPWSAEEDDKLTAAFDAGTVVAVLARAHQRTAGAITSRLIRLGRLQVNRSPAQGESK